MHVLANGQEWFTPEALAPRRVYRLTFSGTYEYYLVEGWFKTREADAVLHMDNQRNFKNQYAGVEVAGFKAGKGQLDSWTEDRVDHVYTCLVEGAGERMPIRVEPPEGKSYSGRLDVKIELLPKSTSSVAARQCQKAEEENAAKAAKKNEEEPEPAIPEASATFPERRAIQKLASFLDSYRQTP